jgi:hypothetical protein
MLNFKDVEETQRLSAKEHLERIGEVQIYFKYLGYFPEPFKKYSSPFSNDSTPSLSFHLGNNLKWHCYSTGKKGDYMDLVAELHRENYKDATLRILNDFKVHNNVQYEPKILATDKFVRYDTKIQVVLQDFSQSDLDYWYQGRIRRSTLDYFDIKVTKQVWLDKGEGPKLIWTYKKDNPIFRYLINGRYKIYKPLEQDKQWKWLSTTKQCDWQGFDQLPATGEILILTKSMKDIMVWYEMGFPAISPCSESQTITKEIIDYFYTRFKKIYINYDFDKPGMLQMLYLKLEFGLPLVITSDIENKDVFDLTKAKGFEYSKQFLINQL